MTELVRQNETALVKPSAPAGSQTALKQFLESKQAQNALSEAAKGALNGTDMVRLTLICATKNPYLLKCTMASILRSLIDLATLGITPGGLNGRGYLVPRSVKVKDPDRGERYETQCFADPGYRGLLDIARESDEIAGISSEVVRENDHFEFWYDPAPKLHFRPLLRGDRGDVVCAFAIAKLRSGADQIEVITKEDLDKIMKVSETGKKNIGPWRDWYDQQARKSALRRLCKFLPVRRSELREKLERALTITDRADAGDPSIGSQEIDLSSPELIDTAESIKGELRGKRSDKSLANDEAELEELEREPGSDG